MISQVYTLGEPIGSLPPKATTEKAQLSEVAGYLPYGLKVRCEILKRDFTIVQEYSENGGPETERTIGAFLSYYQKENNPFVPILRTIDSLGDAEWLGVFKAGMSKKDLARSSEFCTRSNRFFAYLDYVEPKTKHEECRMSFSKVYRNFIHARMEFGQLKAFQKLHELGVDLYDLLGRGLAVTKKASN